MPIVLHNSLTAAAKPATLARGRLALNHADGLLFMRNPAGTGNVELPVGRLAPTTAWAATLLDDANAAAARTTLGVDGLPPGRNLLFNGNFDLWSRGLVFIGSGPGVDCWRHSQASVVRTASAPDVDSLQCVTLSADVGVVGRLSQRIPASIASRMRGRPVTLQLWWLSNSGTPAFNWELAAASVRDNWTTTTVRNSGVVGASPVGSWTFFSVSFTVAADADVANGIELSLFRSSSAGPAATYIARVQLELGATATAFDARPPGVDLVEAQRRFHRIANPADGYHYFGNAIARNSTLLILPVTHPTTLLRAPTLVTGGSFVALDSSLAVTAATMGRWAGNMSEVALTVSGATPGAGYPIYGSNDTAARMDFDADL